MSRPLFYAQMLVIVAYCTGPLAWQVLTSVTPAFELTTLPPLLPTRPTYEHYVSVFTGHPFLRIIANSLIVAAATTALALLVGALAAYAIAKLGVRHKLTILAIVLATSMFPPIATVSPLYLIINALGLRDTLLALILVYTSFSLPLAIWVLTNFFMHVPDEIHRAARIDGCTPFQTFWRIMVPLAAPGFAATAILVFILAWNEFLYALTFTATTASRTIPVGIAMFPGLHEIPWGEIAAASVVVTIPVVFLALVFQRRILEGLTAGAVRG
jgi:multiple sugar transport system permease protein